MKDDPDLDLGFPRYKSTDAVNAVAGMLGVLGGAALIVWSAVNAVTSTRLGAGDLAVTAGMGLLIIGYMGWALRDFPAFVRSRLIVDTVGVHLDSNGSATYRWEEIRGFDVVGPHEFMDLPSAGAVMRLYDGRHISLERLDHLGGDFRNSARAIAEITACVATMNRRLDDARRTADR